jgi:hypothetical protein
MSKIKPIARWARVQNEVLDGVQQIGLVAYHKDGIKEIRYKINVGGKGPADLSTVLSNFGKITTEGDMNGDGIVDATDLSLVLSQFNSEYEVIVSETRTNQKTKIEEYSFDFDFSSLEDGETVTISARVIANDGSELVFDEPYSMNPKEGYENLASYAEPLLVSRLGIHNLVLEKTYVAKTYRVELDGSDTNDGINAPFKTGEKAFSVAISGDTIQFGDGEFVLIRPKTTPSTQGKSKWLTVRGTDKTLFVTKDNKESFGSPKQAIRWINVTLDMGRCGYFYGKDMWWDNCKFINPSNEPWYEDGLAKKGKPDPSIPLSINGKEDNVFRQIGGEQSFTDCFLSNYCSAFSGALLVRNCNIRRIWGDAFSQGNGVFNVNIDTFAGFLTDKHSDIYQGWAVRENVIMVGVYATNVTSVQGIFIRPVLAGSDWYPPNRPVFNPEVDKPCYFGNGAFVNNTFIHTPEPKPEKGIENAGGPPFTQFSNKFFHVLLINHKSPYQKILFGGNTSNDGWEPNIKEDVILMNCDLHWDNISVMETKWNKIEDGYELNGVKALGCYNTVQKS